MNSKHFFISHGLLLTGITLTVLFVKLSGDSAGSVVGRNLHRLVALFAAIIALECIGFLLVHFRKRSQSWVRFVYTTWSCLIVIITLLALVDYRLFVAYRSHIDLSVLAYFVDNVIGLVPIIVSEVTPVVGGLVAVAALISVLLAYSAWNAVPATARTSRKLLIFALCASAISGTYVAGPVVGALVAVASPHTISEAARAYTDLAIERAEASGIENVVVIVLENTRQDAISVYNHEVRTTPFLESLADRSLIVERAYATIPHTTKGLVSILCTFPADVRMRVNEALPHGLPQPCLPELLAPHGYASAYFQTATKHFEDREQLVSNMGFDTFVAGEDLSSTGWENVNYFGLEEKALLQPVMRWVDQQEGPFVMSLLTMSSHHYWQAPPSFPRQQFHEDTTWNEYLNSVHYVDTFLAELYAQFSQRDLLDSTLFVIVADHGEGLYTHGIESHGYNAYEESIRIPLILAGPEQEIEPQRLTGVWQQIDVLPTIINLLGFTFTEGNIPGRDFLSEEAPSHIFSACSFDHCLARISPSEKFIYYLKTGQTEFYDLSTDPEEKTNSVDMLPNETAQRYTHDVLEWAKGVTDFYR